VPETQPEDRSFLLVRGMTQRTRRRSLSPAGRRAIAALFGVICAGLAFYAMRAIGV
jgi:hypothetical protein